MMKILNYKATLLICLAFIFGPAVHLRAEDKTPIVFAAEEMAKRNDADLKFDHTHSAWNEILKEAVVTKGAKSSVRYAALKQGPKRLESYIHSLSDVTKEQYDKFSESEKLSFLINAYNAFTLTLVVNNYPVSSIKKIGGWFSTPWKIQFFKLFGELHSLDDIEHGMIRKWFNEPRIHFALVCAAKSCPPLRNEAYVADRLEEQLSAAARNFLTDRDRNYFDAPTGIVYLSSIFQWYGDDFNKTYRSAKQFIATVMAGSKIEEIKIANEDTPIEYLSYDWALNDASSN